MCSEEYLSKPINLNVSFSAHILSTTCTPLSCVSHCCHYLPLRHYLVSTLVTSIRQLLSKSGVFYLLIYIQQDATLQSLFYLETALHVSGGTTTHRQEGKQLYLQHLVFVTPLLLSVAIVLCSSNSSTIAAGSSNGVTSTRCCRYSCLRS